MSSQYARAGVNPSKIEPFKQAMIEMGRKTLAFPSRRNVSVEIGDHGGIYEYYGPHPHSWSSTNEGLGNKNWIAEWMYQNGGSDARTHYECIGVDTAMMAANDVIAQGAMPVVYLDKVAAGDSDWYTDENRARAFAQGSYRACQMACMALPAGESSSLRYLVKAEVPVRSAPVLSGCVIGIIAPKTRRVSSGVAAGDCIIGVESSGIHSNGITLIIDKGMSLPDRFHTKVPGGTTLGEEVLTPTQCYVELVELLLQQEIEIHAFIPGTGGGVAKIAFDKRPFTYYIEFWPKYIPPIFPFIRDVLNVPIKDCLMTFNWGIGYYIFAPKHAAETAIAIGMSNGFAMHHLGTVQKGDRKVIFGPEDDLVLLPSGD